MFGSAQLVVGLGVISITGRSSRHRLTPQHTEHIDFTPLEPRPARPEGSCRRSDRAEGPVGY